MAEPGVIGEYLAALHRRLPAACVEELADGLNEEYQKRLAAGHSPERAAQAAISAFGEPDTVLAAFADAAPARRAARMLLATGPLVGVCWAAVMLAGHAWAWPVPHALRFLFGTALLASVAGLAVAARARRYSRALHAATAGCIGLLVLDAAMLTAAFALMPGPCWLLVIATPTSTARIAYTLDALHTMTARAAG